MFTIVPAALPGSDTATLLTNPDRGFRLEVYLNVATGKGMYHYQDTDAHAAFEKELAFHAADQPRLAQVYFYLTDYRDKPLDQAAFARMTAYLQMLRDHHIKALLRFAYVWDDAHPRAQEPTLAQILTHIDQLTTIWHDYADAIHVVQAGFIGPWGEWHGDARQRTNETAILQAILHSVPAELQVQLRMDDMKTKNAPYLSTADQARLGYHDDFLIGVPHEWNIGGTDPASPEYQRYLADSAHVLQDGEMIWFWANPIYLQTPTIASRPFIDRLLRNHFTSLSLAHNYLEAESGSFSAQELANELHNQGVNDYPGIPTTTSMLAWQQEALTAADLDARHWPYQPEWFRDAHGQLLSRTAYDYIRDHLGYRIQVQKITYARDLLAGPIKVTLHNYGFAAPLGLAEIMVEAADADNQIIGTTTVPLASVQPGADVLSVVPVPITAKAHRVGVRLAARDGRGARLANIVQQFDGTNWFALPNN